MTIALMLLASLFSTENSEYIKDMNAKHDEGYVFVYTGKHDPTDIPSIPLGDKIYFSMVKTHD